MRFATLVLCLLLGPRLGSGASEVAPDSGQISLSLEALSRLKGVDLEANPALKTVVSNVLNQVRGTPQFVELVRDFKIGNQERPLLEFAAENPATAAGADAMRLVLQNKDNTELRRALAGTNAAALVEAMGNTGENEIVQLLLPTLSDAAKPLATRTGALLALAKAQDGAAGVLELAKAGKLPTDLRLVAATELNKVRWENLKAQAAQVLPLAPTHAATPLPPIRELVKRRGDPVKGAAVFKRESVGCFKCHQIDGEGVDFGPNLSEIGTKLAKDAIYESILDPSAGISFGYEAWDLQLKDGDDALGLLISETADEITLKRVGGMVTRYKKTDIVSRTRQKLSIMPAGLEQTMTVDDLVDLVEFLSSLKKAGP
jgi:putative heme-binding domain-containing protein